MPIRILLADNHTLFREMLKELLDSKGDAYAIVGEAGDATRSLNLVTRYRPNILLIDCLMPGVGSLSAFCKEVSRRSPTTRTLILTDSAAEEVVLKAPLGGVQGYILKDVPITDLLTAIAAVYKGKVWVDRRLPRQLFNAFLRQKGVRAARLARLSRQELKVFSYLAQGMNNRGIGSRLHVSQKTVKNHLTHIFSKLGVIDRQQAVHRFVPQKESAE